MIKYLKILFLGMVVIGLMALPATAVDLRNRNGLSFGTGNSSANSYPIAFEAYSNAGGVSTIADDTTHKGLIEVALAGSLAVGDTVDLKISNGTAQFVSAGPTYRFGLCDPAKNLGACLPGAGSTGGIVGVVNSSGVVTADLGFNILTAVTGPITLWVIQWDDALGATANTIDGAAEGSSIKDGVGLSVNAGLTPSGCDSLPRFIKITFSTPHESSQAEKNFAFITPQFSISGLPATNSAQAELNTDFDFTQFVVGSGPFVSASEPEEINIPPAGPATFFTIVDISGPMWIAFVQNLVPVANLSFNVNSAVPEPCVTVEVIPQSTDVDTTPCTASIDNKTFSCTLSGLPLLDPFQLEFEVNCSADPTAWTF